MSFGGAFAGRWVGGMANKPAPLPPFWDPHSEGLPVVAAYRAIGADSLEASKVNLANPGTYDLTAPVGFTSPLWSKERGWYRAAGTDLWEIGVLAHSSWSFVLRVHNSPTGLYQFACGTDKTTNTSDAMAVIPNYVPGSYGTAFFNTKRAITVPEGTASGTVGIANQRCYRNGLHVATIEVNFTPTNYTRPFFLFSVNRGAVSQVNSYWGDILAFSLYSGTLDDTQMLAVSTAMAALK
ncbi:MAG: hypothetical protein GXY76_08860 [Chloroflexi bacterium]|nr:hypothetical protein [Chloroflexota bacterium]